MHYKIPYTNAHQHIALVVNENWFEAAYFVLSDVLQ